MADLWGRIEGGSERDRKRCPLTTAEVEEEASLMPGTNDVAIVIRLDDVVPVRYVTDHRQVT